MRAELRENFLNLLTSLKNQPMDIEMYEVGFQSVRGTFRGCDPDFNYISLTDLRTPIGIEPAAIVRVTDCISLNFSAQL